MSEYEIINIDKNIPECDINGLVDDNHLLLVSGSTNQEKSFMGVENIFSISYDEMRKFMIDIHELVSADNNQYDLYSCINIIKVDSNTFNNVQINFKKKSQIVKIYNVGSKELIVTLKSYNDNDKVEVNIISDTDVEFTEDSDGYISYSSIFSLKPIIDYIDTFRGCLQSSNGIADDQSTLYLKEDLPNNLKDRNTKVYKNNVNIQCIKETGYKTKKKVIQVPKNNTAPGPIIAVDVHFDTTHKDEETITGITGLGTNRVTISCPVSTTYLKGDVYYYYIVQG